MRLIDLLPASSSAPEDEDEGVMEAPVTVGAVSVGAHPTITLDLLTISLSNSRLFLETIVHVHRVILQSQEHKTFSYFSSKLLIWRSFYGRFYLVLRVKGELSFVMLDCSLIGHFKVFEFRFLFAKNVIIFYL